MAVETQRSFEVAQTTEPGLAILKQIASLEGPCRERGGTFSLADKFATTSDLMRRVTPRLNPVSREFLHFALQGEHTGQLQRHTQLSFIDTKHNYAISVTSVNGHRHALESGSFRLEKDGSKLERIGGTMQDDRALELMDETLIAAVSDAYADHLKLAETHELASDYEVAVALLNSYFAEAQAQLLPTADYQGAARKVRLAMHVPHDFDVEHSATQHGVVIKNTFYPTRTQVDISGYRGSFWLTHTGITHQPELGDPKLSAADTNDAFWYLLDTLSRDHTQAKDLAIPR